HVRADEPANALHYFDLALLGQHLQATSQLLDDGSLPVPQLVQIDGGRAECKPMGPHRLGFFNHLGGVQQGFRRYATDVETNTSQHGPALDQRNLHAEIGGSEGCRIAARTRTPHQNLRGAVEFTLRAIAPAEVRGWHPYGVTTAICPGARAVARLRV